MRAEPPIHAEPIPAIDKTQHQRKRGHDPGKADLGRHLTDGLHDTLQHTDVVLADSDQQRQGGADVEQAGKHAAPRNRARQSTRRIANLIAHHRSQFQSDQAKANHAERIQHKARIGGNFEIGRCDRSAEARTEHDTQADQRRRGDAGADPAQIVQPFAHAQSHDVQNGQQCQQSREAPKAKALLSAKAAWPGPSTNTETPTKYSITVGTYSMLLVQ